MELRQDKKTQRLGSGALGLSGLFCEQPFPLQPRLYPIFFNRPVRDLIGDRSADALPMRRAPGASRTRVPPGIFRNGAMHAVTPSERTRTDGRSQAFIFARITLK